MKKLITGLSIVAASSLMAANIDVYGQAHMSTDSVNNGTDSTTVLASNASRLGVKANTDIGRGLTAVLQYEMGVDLTGQGSNDDGNGGNFNSQAGNGFNNGFFTSARNSFVGVEGGFGKVLVGNLDGVNQSLYDYNLFADQVGDMANIWGMAAPFTDRASNSLAYFIPNVVEGLSAKVQYMFDQTTANDGKTVSGIFAKVDYKKGGLKVGLGYIGLSDDTNSNDPSEVALTGSYTADNFSVGGGFKQISNTSGTNGRTSYNVGASYKLSAVTLKAQYTALNDDVANSDATQVSVGADYALSKEAVVYVAYAGVSNDAGAGYGPNGWGHGKAGMGFPTVGQDPSALSLGVVYKFGGTVYKK